uniref:Peptidase A1 domain-containing protein n=1 Tax=Oryza brachyantha TaxID=4533 RepID=J3N290_ORYBR
MAKISGGSSAAVPPTTSLAAVVVLVLLAGAAASVGAQAAGADDAAADEEARSIAALSKGKVVLKVGDGRVSGKNAATTAILTTTMPFTFLNPALFDHLKQELHTTAAAAMSGGSDFDASLQQQCYPKETKLPELTLLLAGKDAAMALEPEHYSYKKSHGVVCLSILRSPLAGGVSVVGSMLQAGRRMTYNLDDDTLTFDSLSQAKAASSAPSPPSSSLSRYSSHAAVTPAFPVSSAWLSLLLAMMTMGMM